MEGPLAACAPPPPPPPSGGQAPMHSPTSMPGFAELAEELVDELEQIANGANPAESKAFPS